MSVSHIRALIRDLEALVKEHSDGTVVRSAPLVGGFFQRKEMLTLLLEDIRHMILERNQALVAYGRTRDAIASGIEIEKQLSNAKEQWNQMMARLESDKNRWISRVSDEETQKRHEMGQLLFGLIHELDISRHPVVPNRSRILARQARAEPTSVELGEINGLQPEEKEFASSIQARDLAIDQKLDQVLRGIVQLKEISIVIQDEIQVQGQIVDGASNQADMITRKFHTANQTMRSLLEQSGGATRWCPILVIVILLLAIVGYLVTYYGK